MCSVQEFLKTMVKNKNYKKIKKFINDHWKGKLSLARSFWFVGFVVAFIFLLPLLYADLYVDSLSDGSIYFFLVYFLFYMAMAVWINIGIWRSATFYLKKKNANKFYGYGSKAVVLLALFRVVGETILALVN